MTRDPKQTPAQPFTSAQYATYDSFCCTRVLEIGEPAPTSCDHGYAFARRTPAREVEARRLSEVELADLRMRRAAMGELDDRAIDRLNNDLCLYDAHIAALESELQRAREREVSDVAACTAHRACCGTEHDPAVGKLHGYCVVCGVPWPCDTAKHFLRTPGGSND